MTGPSNEWAPIAANVPVFDHMGTTMAGGPDTERLARLKASDTGAITRVEDGVVITKYDPERAPSVSDMLRPAKGNPLADEVEVVAHEGRCT